MSLGKSESIQNSKSTICPMYLKSQAGLKECNTSVYFSSSCESASTFKTITHSSKSKSHSIACGNWLSRERVNKKDLSK